jgi:hypothetical protein
MLTCLSLGMFVAGLLAQPEFAWPRTARGPRQKFTAARATSVAAKPAPRPEVGKVILILQTRDHLVTVRSAGGEESRYSVATLQGIALADGLSAADLKSRFPEVHDVVTGIAWAGM